MNDIILFKIIIFGDESLGKATFFKMAVPDLYSLGLTGSKMIFGWEIYSKLVSVEGQKTKLQLWDLSGDPRFIFFHSRYIRGAQGGLILFDVTKRSSIARIDDWLNLIKNGLTNGVKIPILVVGIVPNEKSERLISAEEGLKIVKSKNLNGYIEYDLKTGKNIEKVFEDLVRMILINAGLLNTP